jgi:hypothetical protein
MAPNVKRTWLAFALMAAGVMAVYWPPHIEPGSAQMAIDYVNLHQRRMSFAREALLGPEHALPGWYPREALGTPYWSNVQNFPWLPNRLLVLLLDPCAPYTYAFAVTLAALLAALFTLLLCRRLGLSPFAAAMCGWTFACSGYFASRVAAGHLPLLEAFAALPMLLWAAERLCASLSPSSFALLALCTTAVLLAGHPQLPAYAICAALLYLPFRVGVRKACWGWTALGLGGAGAAFVWVPMAMLIGRSTRVLGLAAPENDVALPWGRLISFFVPWADGAPIPMARGFEMPFTAWPVQVFWDTGCYVGLAPWLALVALVIVRPRLERGAVFVLGLGLGGLVCALPWFPRLTQALPGTFLRSPARMLYFTELGLALGLALAFDGLAHLKLMRIGLPLIALAHMLSLSLYDREYIITYPVLLAKNDQELATYVQNLGNARAAIDHNLTISANRRVDDLGFFDSIILARTYCTLLDWARARPGLNLQVLDGSALPLWVLEATGVSVVMTIHPRQDLSPLQRVGPIYVLRVPRPSPRAAFVPSSRVRWLPAEALHQALRTEGAALRDILLLPGQPGEPAAEVAGDARVELRRPDPDHLVVRVDAPGPGYLELLESFDRGWTARVDGAPADLLPAMDAWMAVPLAPGAHEVELAFRTPGALAGLAASLGAFTAIIAVALRLRVRRRTA